MAHKLGGKQKLRRVKSREQHVDAIKICKDYFLEAGSLNELRTSGDLVHFHKLEDAQSLEEQICILKKIAKVATENDNKIVSEFCLKFIINLYLEALPGSPCKFALQRFIADVPNVLHDTVSLYMATGISKIINSSWSEENCSSLPVNTVLILSNCFVSNFPVGIKSINECIIQVLDFLHGSILKTLSLLRSQLSPANKLELYSFVHEVLRTLVSLLQKCQANVKNLLAGTCEILPESFAYKFYAELNLNENYGNVKELLESLLASVINLMCHEDLPLDTVCNCGLVVVLVSSLINLNELHKLLSWDSSEYVKKVEKHSTPTLYSYKLSVCCGLLSVLTAEQLLSRPDRNESQIIVQIFKQLINISERNTVESAVVLTVSRAVQQWSHCLFTCMTYSSAEGYIVIISLLNELLSFVWIHVEHYMDSVRYAAQSTLQQIIRAAVMLKEKDFDKGLLLDTIIESVIKIPKHRKSYYIGLSSLGVESGCQKILDKIPDLIDRLLTFLGDTSITAHVSTAFENLMLAHYKECTDSTNWSETWLTPVIQALPHAKSVHSIALEVILSKAVKCCPVVVTQLLVKQLETFSPNQLRIILILLKIGRKQGLFNGEDTGNGMWHGLLDYSLLDQALYHKDEEISVIALSLLVETNRTTEVLSNGELSLVRIFLEYNINTQLPYARQELLRLIKKLLVRMKDSSASLSRTLNQLTNKQHTESYQKDAITAHIRNYNTFLLWLLDFSYASLFPGANFGRRCCALQLLTMIEDIVGYNSTDILWSHSAPNVWTRENADVLLECFKDTYESNKAVACTLLMNFPVTVLEFHDENYICSLFDVCLKMASSNRPPDCITAAYLLSLIVSFPSTVVKYLAPLLPSPLEIPNENNAVFIVTHILIMQLQRQFGIAKDSLLLASIEGPMYGTLFCIRHLLNIANFSKICCSIQWQHLINQLIELCFKLNNVVSCVVNSSSPEGHLPMDFNFISNTNFEGYNSIAVPSTKNVTAQMVLLCSWRTVKEVSLFLGEIAERATVKTDCMDGLLTEEQFLAIGDHFTTLLAETKHRGAFEQAYVGFCKLCSRLWKYPEGTLHKLPETWLRELMEVIAGGGRGKLCATRRSAGLPFMVQALVTSQLQLGSSSSSCFQQCMTTLLVLAAPGGTTEKVVEARTHSLNILRALFRHTALGEMVTPYVAEGIIVAVQGFGGKSWAERNSATLLFSALITRVFGVRRSREELNAKNRMTGRIFFQRYPSLYDFLLEELKTVKHVNGNLQFHPGLFPVLLLLARLYPSSLEGTDSNLQLNVYVPYVHHCARSTVLKTRFLAAQALVPLVTPNIYISYLSQLFCEVSVRQGLSQNERHGILLQILHLLKNIPESNTINDEEIQKYVNHWVIQTMWHVTEINTTHCFITLSTYVETLIYFYENFHSVISLKIWKEILAKLEDMLFDSTGHKCFFSVGRHGFQEQAAKFCLLLYFYQSMSTPSQQTELSLEQLLTKLLTHTSYEVVIISLGFILSFLGDESEEEDEEDVCSYRLFWNKIICNVTVKTTLNNKLFVNDNFLQTLIELATCKNSYYLCKKLSLQVLSYLETVFVKASLFPQSIKYLIEICKTEHENNASAIIRCIGTFLNTRSSQNISADYVDDLVWLIYNFTSPEKLYLCRLSVAQLLVKNSIILSGTVPFFSDTDLCTLWTSVFVLLHDDMLVVRELISELLMKLVLHQGTPVIASKAREDLLQYFINFMKERNKLCCVVALFAWALKDTEQEEDLENVSEERVFDKGEMNIYCEDVIVTELMCSQLEKILCQELLYNELPVKLKQWFIEVCLPNVTCPEVNETSILLDLLKIVCKKKGTFMMPSEFSNIRASHFLVPNERSVYLSAMKTKRVLQVISQAEMCCMDNQINVTNSPFLINKFSYK